MSDERDSMTRSGSSAADLSIIGALSTGVGGMVGGLIATLNGELIGGGIYLLAASLAFGLVTNAVFRR